MIITSSYDCTANVYTLLDCWFLVGFLLKKCIKLHYFLISLCKTLFFMKRPLHPNHKPPRHHPPRRIIRTRSHNLPLRTRNRHPPRQIYFLRAKIKIQTIFNNRRQNQPYLIKFRNFSQRPNFFEQLNPNKTNPKSRTCYGRASILYCRLAQTAPHRDPRDPRDRAPGS